jgi:hypothetical protein
MTPTLANYGPDILKWDCSHLIWIDAIQEIKTHTIFDSVYISKYEFSAVVRGLGDNLSSLRFHDLIDELRYRLGCKFIPLNSTPNTGYFSLIKDGLPL